MRGRMMRFHLLFVVLLVFPSFVLAGGALETIQTQVRRVLEILADPTLKADPAHKTREEKIWAIVCEIFDFTELSKRTLARNWEKLTPDEQKEFERLFGKLLGTIYMNKILTYTDEKVVFGKERMLTEKTAEVQSKIVTKTDEIPIHYKLISKDGRWKVYDVLVEGVSLIQNYRSQFNEMLMKKSPQILLEHLRKKLEQPKRSFAPFPSPGRLSGSV